MKYFIKLRDIRKLPLAQSRHQQQTHEKCSKDNRNLSLNLWFRYQAWIQRGLRLQACLPWAIFSAPYGNRSTSWLLTFRHFIIVKIEIWAISWSIWGSEVYPRLGSWIYSWHARWDVYSSGWDRRFLKFRWTPSPPWLCIKALQIPCFRGKYHHLCSYQSYRTSLNLQDLKWLRKANYPTKERLGLPGFFWRLHFYQVDRLCSIIYSLMIR